MLLLCVSALALSIWQNLYVLFWVANKRLGPTTLPLCLNPFTLSRYPYHTATELGNAHDPSFTGVIACDYALANTEAFTHEPSLAPAERTSKRKSAEGGRREFTCYAMACILAEEISRSYKQCL